MILRRPVHTYISGRNTNGYNHFGRKCGYITKLHINLSFGTAIPSLEIYSLNKPPTIQKHITTLFVMAKYLKQPKYSYIGECLNKLNTPTKWSAV